MVLILDNIFFSDIVHRFVLQLEAGDVFFAEDQSTVGAPFVCLLPVNIHDTPAAVYRLPQCQVCF